MRWRPLAAAVIEQLNKADALKKNRFAEVSQLIKAGEATRAFRQVHQLMSGAGWPVGWNKIVRGGNIHGWFGPAITVHPLRLAALELEADEDTWTAARQILQALWNGDSASSTDESWRAAISHLAEFGVDPGRMNLDQTGLALLQRLNLDRRDHPFIERWWWSGRMGSALLSDNGRIQVTREMVWARAVEAGLNAGGSLNDSMKDFLTQADPDAVDIIIPDSMNQGYSAEGADEPLERCLKRLEFYGLSKREIDRALLAVPAGGFPSNALRLWISNKCQAASSM